MFIHLFLTPSFPPDTKSGIDAVAYKYKKNLEKKGDKAYVITLSYKFKELQKEEIKSGIFRFNFTSRKDLINGNTKNYIINKLNFVTFDKIDFIHCHDWFLVDLVDYFKRKLSTKTIGFFHSCKFQEYKGNLNNERVLIHKKQKILYDKSDLLVVNSNNMILSVKEYMGDYKDIIKIRCGMENSTTKIKKYRNDMFKIYYYGRLTKEKNIELLVQSFQKIQKNHNVSLLIRGKGIESQKIKKNKYENIDIREWTGNKKDLFNEIKEQDLVVLPSYYEPFGMVILESLSNGVPVIISNNCGCKEIFKKANKFCFSLDIEGDLSKKIISIMNNYHEYSNDLNEEIKQIRDNYNWEKEISKFCLRIYDL